MSTGLIEKISEKYGDYLTDESRLTGFADSISFPRSEEEVIRIIRELKGTPITIQGANTGIVGGAVPRGGHIMNLSGMKRVFDFKLLRSGEGRITVEPGLTLDELAVAVTSCFKRTPMFWPPRPTETTATVGGVAALAAKGINACHYGDSRKYIEEIRFVDDGGAVHTVSRDRDAEELDQLLGSEGIAGPVTRLTLRLLPKPESVWGLGFFFTEDGQAELCAEALRHLPSENDNAWVSAMEYMDKNTLDLIESRKIVVEGIRSLPDVPKDTRAMIYVELEGEDQGIEELMVCIAGITDGHGSDPDKAWAVMGEADADKLHVFRHTAPEAVNLRIAGVRSIDDRIRKLGTDIAFPERDIRETIEEYRKDLRESGLPGCIFGGISDSHMHVNIVPVNYEQYAAGKELIQRWSAKAAGKGGSVITEHGIGKLKQEIMSSGQLESVRDFYRPLKEKYDPENIFNRGDIFEDK